jgi:hypothetical protein
VAEEAAEVAERLQMEEAAVAAAAVAADAERLLGRVFSKVSPLWTPVWRGVFYRPSVWRSGTTGKQLANLAVEGAGESLSIIPDYTPTVRPPPKRC